jgi:polyferredoxin
MLDNVATISAAPTWICCTCPLVFHTTVAMLNDTEKLASRAHKTPLALKIMRNEAETVALLKVCIFLAVASIFLAIASFN